MSDLLRCWRHSSFVVYGQTFSCCDKQLYCFGHRASKRVKAYRARKYNRFFSLGGYEKLSLTYGLSNSFNLNPINGHSSLSRYFLWKCLRNMLTYLKNKHRCIKFIKWCFYSSFKWFVTSKLVVIFQRNEIQDNNFSEQFFNFLFTNSSDDSYQWTLWAASWRHFTIRSWLECEK